jgi:phosphomannomutase
MSNIKFGTDGWRAIIDKDFTDENVKRTSFAIAKYILDNFGVEKTVLIGYDPRLKADYFANISAEIFKNLGFNVLLSDKVVPTPVLAYSAKLLNACAIMFTASHNPPEYLGMKFIPDYAGPATNEITSEIVANIDKEVSSEKVGMITLFDFEPAYVEHIEKLIDFDKIKSANLKVNYDALHGADGTILTNLFKKYNVICNATNLNYDCNFGGKLPEPAEKFLSELKQQCLNSHCIGFSNDGDGDRFALIDENGCFVSANEVIAILLKHLKQNRHFTGKLVKTVAGSLMLDIYAKKNGVDVVETPVGFKWVGQAMRENETIIGGEESGGLSIKGHIPEKDGIIANLLICEALAYFKKTAVELRQDIVNDTKATFVNKRNDAKLSNDELVIKALENLKKIDKIAGYDIIRKNYADGIKLYLNDNVTSILVRKSGTEPLLRIYCESDSEEKQNKIFSEIDKIIK